MSELLNLSVQPRRTFRKHFLAVVHAEISFPELEISRVLENRTTLEGVLKSSGFVESRQVIQNEFSFESQPDKIAKLSQQAQPVGLLFVSQTPRRELQVQRDRLILTDYAYEGFEAFSDRFRISFDGIGHILGLDKSTTISKVGLRKVNSVVMEPVSSLPDALSVFNPSLFNLARSGLLRREAFKASEEVTVLDRDNKICLLRTRLQQKSETSLEANLDFDFVSTLPQSCEEVFSGVLPALNQAHFDLFMWAVTAELIQLMEKE